MLHHINASQKIAASLTTLVKAAEPQAARG